MRRHTAFLTMANPSPTSIAKRFYDDTETRIFEILKMRIVNYSL